jgi:SPP1 gp7 family putative phage head morphogenesis protein
VTKERARRVLPLVYRLYRVLAKTSDEGQSKAWAEVAKIRERYDADFEGVFRDWLTDIRSSLAGMDADTKAGFIQGIKDAFSTDSLLDSYTDVLNDFLKSFESETDKYLADISIDYDTVNTKAVDSLQAAVEKSFGNFAKDQSDRIHQILEDGLASGTPTRDIAAALADGMSSVAYRNADGDVYRTLSPEVWANQVARTECNRAYATSVAESLKSAGLQLWQCIVADDERTCDECSQNDGAIVNIGDDLPSGDVVPIHSNCRCTMIAVSEELLGDAA